MKVKIKDIKANPNNPRVIRDEQFKKLVKSIQEFPEMLSVRKLVCTPDMIVLGGNMRLKALQSAGIKEVDVEIVDWDEQKQKEFIIKDNVSFGEWNHEQLANEWDAIELEDWGLELPVNVDVETLEAVDDEYEMPDAIHSDVVLGDLIEIGEHRLLCGDSTNADDVRKLLQGKEPYLMVTDPPYGVIYDASWRDDALNGQETGRAKGKVKNDHKADWTEAWALSPAKVSYVYHADKYGGIVQESLEKCDFEIRCQIIWYKNHFAIGRGDYQRKHEPCWYAVKKGNKANWAGDRKQTTVWEINKPQKNDTGHSTQKPVECMYKPIANHDGDVYDPFCGSGTTMVASQQLNRVCYGMELDTKYCQVIIDRMMKAFPELPVKINGKAYKK